ncbi:NADH-quinone oxidoreductase subunit L [Rhodococcus sp. BP-252]|uniref:NADH-quinone oxidoreductase subunit L n=1 Tax=unclassified Rhodococcus (in: high G+C Gram-positive bacteria) TaxID=192944 RepID=UPI001C9A3664|nr:MULTISPECIES: NADH-quinone oxidoreductase subunit L [unclassified Rhodococcus (in: high G+C Gram-positive bacteria)]MBY6411046.1 NADH-quinone oxidoreductase subunit L [Rhodococcus sp. BP-320]MBY6415705.1 NADH-quinone oxidoreductase subunit L [Rhodococcus sp. BP-321]MBY6420913.1 NADH-quinone oxidoreductase subunit L [Rhodococcus sp. BP-324]MBY6425968.1 NADH-quinone oxidoreductase subunit L [Rhodococcus sp. BP-323]MBY6430911.1 NADH-quinone oxidoreductase subunit L [Rhodococcus sp. BP-322]
MTAIWILPALPLLGAVVLLLLGRRTDRFGHLVGTVMSSAAFVYALVLFADMLGKPADERAVSETLFSWIPVADLQVDFGFRLDQLSMCFVLLITGVGSLIHVYAIGYMADDPDRRRFFAYLNLFLAAMLLLVTADNFLGLYVGWEGVGLASYLLIGFWQYKPSAATAAKKAFVVNRVGDIGLMVALMIMFATYGSVSFDDVFAGVDDTSSGTLTALGLVLLLAACGKSAQVPLQSWLGDAMEGPTPVSALIHAATMVTAGVYLIVRAGPVFESAPAAQAAVVAVGAVTLLFGAVIGCAKDDIKKALAASTMSQIGYMVLAAGLGPAGYTFAIMLLLTHGFFKAGLFLGAGSVMHGMNDEVDMRKYGALRTAMPITFVTFGLGYLAIIGVPPFSGFFAKDKIIETAFGAGGVQGVVLGVATLVGAGLTAFYMTRVMLMTFFGDARWDGGSGAGRNDPVEDGSGAGRNDQVREGSHPHESPSVMTAPMIVLAVGSVAAGALLTVGGSLSNWLVPVVGEAEEAHMLPAWVVTVLALGVVAVGIAVAYMRYARSAVPSVAPEPVSALTTAARRDLYGDAVNEALLMRPGQELTRAAARFDEAAIAGVTRGVSGGVSSLSTRIRQVQSGYVRSYALTMLAGTAVVLAMMVAVMVW